MALGMANKTLNSPLRRKIGLHKITNSKHFCILIHYKKCTSENMQLSHYLITQKRE